MENKKEPSASSFPTAINIPFFAQYVLSTGTPYYTNIISKIEKKVGGLFTMYFLCIHLSRLRK